MVWQLFYYLNVGFPTRFPVDNDEDYENEFNSSNFWDRFNCSISDSSDEDLFYLLQAFFEIANERSKNKDWDLIKLVCLNIFYVSLHLFLEIKNIKAKYNNIFYRLASSMNEHVTYATKHPEIS